MKKLGLLALVLSACTDDPKPTITVAPETANVLTCSTEPLTTTVTNLADTSVTWSASPGSVDASGLYTSPISTPVDGAATVTATSVADATLSASSQLTLATAFPQVAASVGGAPGSNGTTGTVGIYEHSVVARANRVYALSQINPVGATTVSLQFARSDDGGLTWQAPHAVFSAAIGNGMDTSQVWLECQSLAIDAANPDVIYTVARVSGPNSLGAAVNAPNVATLVYAVSTDGGATFTPSVLHADTPIGYCADVVSPAANTVVIDDPVDDCTDNKDVWIWSDTNRGAAFAQGVGTTDAYLANGSTNGLDRIDGRACNDSARIDVEQNGNTDFGGDATEAPRLFTDGAGRVCITYIANTTAMSPTPIHAYVQCTDNLGVSFSAPLALDTSAPGLDHSHASGAFGKSGAAAIAWMTATSTANSSSAIYVALSGDAGRTFGAAKKIVAYQIPGPSQDVQTINPSLMYDADGILWLTYRLFDGLVDRIIVDKSCDGGTTWSGPVLVNGTEEQIVSSTFTGMKWPALVAAPEGPPMLVASPSDRVDVFTLTP